MKTFWVMGAGVWLLSCPFAWAAEGSHVEGSHAEGSHADDGYAETTAESSQAEPTLGATDTLQLMKKARPLTTEEGIVLFKAAKRLREEGENELSLELERVAGKLTTM